MTHVRHLALIALLAVGAISAHAQDSADITINFEVAEVRVFEAGNDTVNLILDMVDSDGTLERTPSQPATFNNIAYNGSNPQKITVKLDQDMPDGMQLDLFAGFGSVYGVVIGLGSIEKDLFPSIAGPFSASASIDFLLYDVSGPGTILPAQIGSRICTITMMDE